jgi:hypothetical protein
MSGGWSGLGSKSSRQVQDCGMQAVRTVRQRTMAGCPHRLMSSDVRIHGLPSRWSNRFRLVRLVHAITNQMSLFHLGLGSQLLAVLSRHHNPLHNNPLHSTDPAQQADAFAVWTSSPIFPELWALCRHKRLLAFPRSPDWQPKLPSERDHEAPSSVDARGSRRSRSRHFTVRRSFRKGVIMIM